VDDADLTEHICQVLAQLGLGVWRPDGPAYTAAETGIYYGDLATSPDRGIGVSVYATDDDPVTATAMRWVQFRIRGAQGVMRDADQMAGALFDALQDRRHAAPVSRFLRTSSARLGADENGRQERSDNYQIILSPKPLEAS